MGLEIEGRIACDEDSIDDGLLEGLQIEGTQFGFIIDSIVKQC